MDLRPIGTDPCTTTSTPTASGVVTSTGAGSSGSYPQQQRATSTPSSSSSSSSASQPFQRHLHSHLHRPPHPHPHQHHQLYNLLPPQQSSSYSPIPTTSTTTDTNNSQYFDRNDEEAGSSSSWVRSGELQPQHHQHHQQQHHQQPSNIKRETVVGRNTDGPNGRNMDDPLPSTSDFVKKLYKMLEDPSFQNIVCWGPLGDCFVVKDMNEFTKAILPRMFKHSNFASFVRQLNKYDFHKVKNTDDNLFGEHSWTFRHPNFHADRREALENIKRKVPAQRKNGSIPNSTTTSLSSSTNSNYHHRHHHHSSSSPSVHHNPHSHTTTSPPYSSHINRRSPSPSSSHTTPTPNSYHRLKQEVLELKSRLHTLESTYESRLTNLETNYENRLNNLESGYESRLRGLEMGYEGRMRGLEKNYESVLVEMVGFQRGVAQQDGVVKSLIRCFLGGEGKLKATSTMTPNRHLATMTTAGLLLPSSASTSISSVQTEGGSGQFQQRQSRDQHQTSSQPASLPFSQSQPLPSPHVGKGYTNVQQQQQQSSTSTGPPSSTPWPSSSSSTLMNTNNGNTLSFGEDEDESPSTSSVKNVNEGLQVYTVGHLMPRNTFDGSGNWNFDTDGFSNRVTASSSASNGLMYGPAVVGSETVGSPRAGNTDDDEVLRSGLLPSTAKSASPNLSASSSTLSPSSCSSPPKKLRVRRATFVPGGWAVPPRVLLVDDDAVIRKLSSKFLKIFGCTTDVAVDGIGAVTKMNLEKYDLVLMDILMPKLDGISATNLIRKFDRGTPIISMTVNSKPNEIMEYYSSGMNDVLPKPFTKEGLLDMLEKHLMHLKVIQQMTTIPRSVGVPPLSDANFEQVLMTNAMMIQQQQQQQQLQLQRRSSPAGLPVSGNTSDALSSTTNTLSPPIPLPPPPQSQSQSHHQQQQQQLSFTSLLGMGEDDSKINPLAGMGLSDEQYNTILQNLVNGEKFMGMGMGGNNAGVGNGGSGVRGGMKRTVEDVGSSGEERGGKRGRFEVVE